MTCAHLYLQSLKKVTTLKIQQEISILIEKSTRNQSVMTLATTIQSKTLLVSISIHQEAATIVVSLTQLNHLQSTRTNNPPFTQKLRIKIEFKRI